MPLAPETMTWDGLEFSSDGSSGLVLGDKIRGFGQGSHRMPTMDRLAGGGASGIAVPTPKLIDVDVWANDLDKLNELRAKMAPRPLPSDVLPLAWRGLGWGDHELCVFARPAAQNHDVTQEAPQGVVAGINCQWQADDPTVYDLEATTLTQASPTSLATFEWTNQGTSTPLPGLGGHAWEVEVTAASTVVRPYVLCGSRRVTFRNLTMSAGQKLVIPASRIPMVGTSFTVGRSGNPPSPSPQWPTLEAGVERLFRVGAQSGTFTVVAQFRSTW